MSMADRDKGPRSQLSRAAQERGEYGSRPIARSCQACGSWLPAGSYPGEAYNKKGELICGGCEVYQKTGTTGWQWPVDGKGYDVRYRQ